MSDCIEWDRGRFAEGYGAVWRDGKTQKAHRVAYADAYGPIPDGIFVCHTCDNPPCVNLEHLFLGTPNDNVQDMIRKGRNRSPGAPRRDFCVAGHPLDGENLIISNRRNGGELRGCRECGRRRAREHYRKKHNVADEAKRVE